MLYNDFSVVIVLGLVVVMLLRINGLQRCRNSVSCGCCISNVSKRSSSRNISMKCNSNLIETLMYNSVSNTNSDSNDDVAMLINSRGISNVIDTNANNANRMIWSISRADIQLDSTVLEPQYLSGYFQSSSISSSSSSSSDHHR